MKKRDLEFLFEIGAIRHIERLWSRFGSSDFANLAEHHFRVAWIAMIIAKNEGSVDFEKLIKLSLLHDIAESRTGDADYLSRQYVERNEDLGISDMISETSLEREFYSLWGEYKEKRTLEAKIVKDADQLDVDLEIKEQEFAGNRIGEGWTEDRRKHVRDNLYTKTAKEIWDSIQNSNPHDWHYKGRNRGNAGDWKKAESS